MTRRILCFGDSLTWGWTPVTEVGASTTRYAAADRWPGIMRAALGPGHEVIEEGLNGRTTSVDDPLDPRLNGAAYLPAALASHLPLDLVIVMLGTNDLKAHLHRSATDIAAGIALLLKQIAAAGGSGTSYPAPRALVIAPPPLGAHPDPWTRAQLAQGNERLGELTPLLAALAARNRTAFLDAGAVLTTGGADGVHFTRENNAALGRAVARTVAGLWG
ncbi:SGNH/GDSL hydrolase family protein [Propionicicella superfundia]|uniref:SGNH/GDSL hydrolase family protein n=1 Tax=Propionicicella superfundia TaxID=348582 RepID=UPI000414C2D2|nr:SGNH/GDSL hydrolase family protein [Propionicicella superfundia]